MTYANTTETETATNDYVAEFTSENNLKNNLTMALELHTNFGVDGNVTAAYKLPDTDLKAGRLIKKAFGDEIVYVPTSRSTGEWFIWDGTIFVKTVDDELLDDNLVNALSDAMHNVIIRLRAAENSDPTPSDDEKSTAFDKAIYEAAKYARDIENERNNSNLRKRIRKAFQVAATHFDNDRDYVVFADGQVLDTRNPEAGLLAPSASRPVSRKMGIDLGPVGAVPTQFLKGLDDRDLSQDEQRYLKVAAGAALLGRGDAKNIVNLVGGTNTGKSSFIRTMMLSFGGYAGMLPAGAIVAKSSTNFEQHAARGVRFLCLEEPIECKTDDSFLKNLAGGGNLVPTQQKGRDVVYWLPQCVLFIAANHIPKMNTQDDAIVGRMNIIGFNRKFTKGDGTYEKNIEDRIIREEGPAIARWMVEGAIEFLALGQNLPVTASIIENANDNVTSGSVALRWLEEQFEEGNLTDGRKGPYYLPGTSMVENRPSTYQLFTNWAFNEGVKNVPDKKQWAEDINKFMGQPVIEAKKRPGGYYRLWNVGTPAKVKAAPVVSPIKVNADGVGTF